MAKKYRGRPPKIRKTIRGEKFNPDKFFGLFSSLKRSSLENQKDKGESVGNVDNIASIGRFNISDIALPFIHDEENQEQKQNPIGNVYNNIYKTFNSGGLVEVVKNYNNIVNEYITKRSFVPSTYPQTWKDAAKSKYQPFEQLSPEKLASVFAYTEDKTKIYQKVNQLLRTGDYSGEDKEDVKFFTENLQGALKELTSSEGETVELHRVISGDYADTISQLQPGDTFEEKGFGSWSQGEYNNPRGDQFLKKGETNVVLRTESNKGYDVSPISKYPRESEYIIAPVQKYSIENITPDAIYSRRVGDVPKIDLKQFFSGGKITTESGESVKGLPGVSGVDGVSGVSGVDSATNSSSKIDLNQFFSGDKITTESGKDITGAGVDTQLIAAQPGEVVINKETVNAVGADYFLNLNKVFGGEDSNKPKEAKVQAASGGGIIESLRSYAVGGVVEDEEVIDSTVSKMLGLDFADDFTKEELQTLLKEFLVKYQEGSTVTTEEERSKIDTGDLQRVKEEFIRLKKEKSAPQKRYRVTKIATKETFTGFGGTSPVEPPGPPTAGLTSKMLPGGVGALAPYIPQSFQEESADVETEAEKKKRQKKQTPLDSLEQNVRAIRKTVDSIFKTLTEQNKFFGKQAEKERKSLENQRRSKKEDRYEAKKDKKFKKAFEKTVKPFSNILNGIINYLTAILFGRAFTKLMDWFTDPDNKSKVESIGRFLKDFWPALLGAYLIFGNSLGRFVANIIGTVTKMTFRLLKFAIPKLIKVIRKNPIAAAATAIIGGAAIGGLMQSQTPSNDPERAEEGKTQLEDTQDFGGTTGAPISGDMLGFAAGGMVPVDLNPPKEQKVQQPQEQKQEEINPLINLLGMTPAGMALKGAMSLGSVVKDKGLEAFDNLKGFVNEKSITNTLMMNPLIKMGAFAFNKTMNFGKDPARDITGNSGTDVKGAGVDTQLISARPGDIVINKEAATAMGPNYFDTISSGTGEKISGAGPDTQMIAARPGEIVINRETVNAVGADHFLGLNKLFGGPGANKPKTAKVQAASGGGYVLPAFSSGGMVGAEEVPAFVDKPASEYNEGEETPNVRIPSPEDQEKEEEVAKSSPASISSGGSKLKTGTMTPVEPKNQIIPSTKLEKSSTAEGNKKERKGLFGRIASGLGSVFGNISKTSLESAKQSVPSQTIAMSTPAVSGGSGGGSAPSVGSISNTQKEALAVLAKYESGAAGYDAVNQIGTNNGRGVLGFSGDIKKMKQYDGRSLTDFTIGEIKKLQYDDKSLSNKQWINEGKLHAVGRYQFIGNTLPGVAQRAGIPDDAKFTTEVQDIMALQLMKERGISPWVGPSDKATAEERAVVERARAENLPEVTGGDEKEKAQVAKDQKKEQPSVTPDKQDKPTARTRMGRISPSKQNMSGKTPTPKATATTPAVPAKPFNKRSRTGRISSSNQNMTGKTPIASTTPKQSTPTESLISSPAAEVKKPSVSEIENMDIRTLNSFLDPGKTGASFPLVFAAAKAAKEKARAEGIPEDEVQRLGQVAAVTAKLYGNTKDKLTPPIRKDFNLNIPKIDIAGMKNPFQTGEVKENSGIDIAGATADRQLIKAQPGEYMLPTDTVMRLGGPKVLDSLVARTDSNSTAAKLGTISKPSMAVEQPVMEDMSMIETLPPITQSSGGGGDQGGGRGSDIPGVTISDNAARRQARTMYGLV